MKNYIIQKGNGIKKRKSWSFPIAVEGQEKIVSVFEMKIKGKKCLIVATTDAVYRFPIAKINNTKEIGDGKPDRT